MEQQAAGIAGLVVRGAAAARHTAYGLVENKEADLLGGYVTPDLGEVEDGTDDAIAPRDDELVAFADQSDGLGRVPRARRGFRHSCRTGAKQQIVFLVISATPQLGPHTCRNHISNWRSCACLSSLGSCVRQALKHRGLTLDIGKTAQAFHVDIAARKLPVNAPTSEHDVFFMEDLLAAAGLENNILMVEAKVDNAFALMHFATRDGKPMCVIVYNVNWLVGLATASGGNRDIIVERHLILGREIGHHVCKHTTGKSGLPKEKELEADRFAGALIRAASTKTSYAQGIQLTDLISAGKVVFPVDGSRSHPARDERLAAIAEGWENGLPCR